MSVQITNLVILMILGGVAGSAANYVTTEVPEGEIYPLNRRSVSGIAAALVVPLFLNMISSDLLSAIEACLADEVSIRTDEFYDCRREQDVRVGCEDQPDGSRLCY